MGLGLFNRGSMLDDRMIDDLQFFTFAIEEADHLALHFRRCADGSDRADQRTMIALSEANDGAQALAAVRRTADGLQPHHLGQRFRTRQRRIFDRVGHDLIGQHTRAADRFDQVNRMQAGGLRGVIDRVAGIDHRLRRVQEAFVSRCAFDDAR